jgi:hypothetical protein
MKKIYTLIGVLMLTGSSMAQHQHATATYDFAPNDKYAPGGITYTPIRPDAEDNDRTVYYSENFDAGLGIWTNAIQSGPVGFELTNVGHSNSNGNTFIIPALLSTTPTQWVILDSDAGSTSYGVAEAATLTSSVIDLSATTGNYVAFEFEQFFAEWQPTETEDHLFLGVSVDGGSNWTEIEISEGVGREARPNPEKVSWDISDEILGNENNVMLRFRWDGDWNYGWQIDNIEVVDINDNDIQIVDTWRTYSTLGGLNYSQVPEAQAAPFTIGAIIRNVGHFDATNVTFNYVIKDPSNTQVDNGTATTTLTLANAEQDTIIYETGYTPTALGNYTIEWTAVSTEGEVGGGDADNLASDAHYELTDFSYATYYDEGSVEEIDNWPLMTGTAWFGSLFDFVGNDVISGIDVKITDNPLAVGEQIFGSIFYFPDGGTEWLQIWDSSNDSYSIQSSDLGNWVTIPTGGFNVNTTDFYMVTVGQWSSAPEPLFERQGDIGWNYIQGRDQDNANRGFFDRKSPLVRARVNSGEVGIDDSEMEDKFLVYPNPANDIVNVNITLTNAENTTINVRDISGKVIQTINLGTVNGEQKVAISVAEFSTGVYFIEMTNTNGKQVKKFVKK